MKHRLLSFVVLVALGLVSVVPLEAQDEPEGFPLAITDGAGRELTFNAPPQRVVTYYNDSYGMLATLGLMPVAQSVNPEMLTDPIYFEGQGGDIPTIGYTDSHDLEDVTAAQPDLVMVYSAEEAQALEGIAPAFVTYNPTTMDELYEALRQYGTLFAREVEAEAAITAFQDRLAAYQALAPGGVSVLKLGAMDNGAFWISTIDDPICQILNMLARCEWQKATPDEFWGYETTIEGVLALDPDVIILNNWSSVSRDDMLAALADNPLWNELRAVQDERVIGTPGYENPIASSLPAATKFLDTYLPLLYPDVFPEALTEEQVEEIASQSTQSEFPMTIVDGAGRELTFDEAPQRVVCTYTRCMELLAALEFAPVGVASWVEDFASDPAYFSQPNEIVIIPEDGDVPNLEQIAALQPDLVFGWAELVDALAGIAPVYVVVDGQDSYQESHDEIRMFARLLGQEDIAEANIQSALDRLAAYQALAPRDVSVMYGFFSDGAFSYRDGQSGTCNLLNQVARCDWADPEGSASWSVQINDEALLALNPDVLLISGYGFEGQTTEEVIADLAARPLWAELTAVQTGQVHVITTSPTNMDGMGTVGMAQMLDVLMPLIYPDVFPEALTDEQVEAGESVNSSGYPVTVTDMTGQELTFDGPPQRVICLLNRCAQELAFIGVAPIAVGAPYTFNIARDPVNFGEQAEAFGQIPQGSDLDWELIASFEPDLIIGEAEMRDAAEGIAQVYAYSWDTRVWQSIDNFTTDVRNFGQIFGLESEVEAKIQSVLDRVAAYAALSPNDRSHLVFFFSDDTGSSLWLPGDFGLFLSQLSPCGNPNGGDWIEGTIETLLAFDPDVLIVEQYSVDDEAAMLENLNATNPLWNELTAVQNDDVYLVPVSQARTNTIQSVKGAVDALMPLIYPDIFPEALTDAQVQEILVGQNTDAATGNGFPLTITDRLGGEVTLESPAERIFCLLEPCLHALAALDELPAGVWPFYYQFVLSDPALFGERAAQIPILDGLESVDLEAVAALDPDLIIAWPGYEAYLPQEFVSTVAPVFQAGYDLMMSDIDTLGHDLRMIAAAVGRADAAEAILEPLEARQDAYLRVLGETPRREVLVIRLESPDTNSIWALPCGPLMAQITTCVNTTGDWFQYSPESLLAADAEVLIVEDWGDNVGTFAPSTWSNAGVPLWNEIPAVRDGQTYYVPVIATAPYSPIAWEQTLDTLMPLLYPDLFPNGALTDEQVQDILAEQGSAASADAFPVTITDGAGLAVTLEAPPQRIVCMPTPCVHALAIFGIVPLAASRDNINAGLDEMVLGEAANGITEIVWTDGYDIEAILALNPDLVVSWQGAEEWMPMDVLRESVPVYNSVDYDVSDSLEPFEAEIRNYGVMLGREAEAEAFITETRNRIEAYDTLSEPTTSVAFVPAALNENFFIITPTCGPALERLITCVGNTGEWIEVTTEGLLSFNPDVLIIEDWGEGITLEALATLPLWSELAAVQSERVYLMSPSRTIDYSLLSIANSLDTVMPLAYPDIFPEPLTDEQVEEILTGAS